MDPRAHVCAWERLGRCTDRALPSSSHLLSFAHFCRVRSIAPQGPKVLPAPETEEDSLGPAAWSETHA